MVSYDPEPEPAWDTYEVPKGLKPLAERVEIYRVKNKYENPIMGADISSTYEFVDLAEGLWVRVRSPMGTVMEFTFTVGETGGGCLEIIHRAECKCNKALAAMTKKDADKSFGILVGNIAKRIGET